MTIGTDQLDAWGRTLTECDELREVVRELVRDKGHRVHEWPDDEAAAYRDNGGFAPGRQAVEDVRVAKGVAALDKIITDRLRASEVPAEDLRAEGARWAHEAIAAKFEDKYPSIAQYIRALGETVQPNESEED